MAGPLKGLRIVEMVGIGPGPFCAMLLADMGAEVVRIDLKPGTGRRQDLDAVGASDPAFDVCGRGRRSVALDLKKPEGKAAALELIGRADAVLEGFRPGVMERLGLGPEICLARNPRLVFGRMTGWGQTGPLSNAAGHDLNYVALSGLLHTMGEADRPPPPPLNLVGDFGGGGLLLAFGMVCALLEARQSGKGQVVDGAMSDGSALLGSMIYGFKAAGFHTDQRGANMLDGGSHFYGCYECADGRFVAIGAVEPQFYALLLEKTGLDDPRFREQLNRRQWPELKKAMAERIRTRTRDEWCVLMEGTDVCFAPVLDMNEAPLHPHNQARGTFVNIGDVMQPAPAPRFSRTQPDTPAVTARRGAHTFEVLADWGFSAEAVETLVAADAIAPRRA